VAIRVKHLLGARLQHISDRPTSMIPQSKPRAMNRIIRTWMPRQAAEADKLFRGMYGASLEERFTGDEYQLMHVEMFPHHIIHAECVGGEIDLLVNRRTTIYHEAYRDAKLLCPYCVRQLNENDSE
jgi:hypothetical protein